MVPASRSGWLLLALLFPAGAAAATLTRGPFLQLGSESSMLVVWSTAEPADSSVEHWTEAGVVVRDSDPGKVTAHAVLVTDLVAGTLYHYRVLSDGEVLAE